MLNTEDGGGLAGVAYASTGYEGTTLLTPLAMIIIGLLVWLLLPEILSQPENGSPSVGSETQSSRTEN